MRALVGIFLVLLTGCGHSGLKPTASTRPTWETVEFESLDNTRLTAQVFRPPGNGPFHAIVALHGCSGLFNEHAVLNSREATWAKIWVKSGFVVVFPDSFSARGIQEICKSEYDREFVRTTRPRDAYGALRWLRQQPFVGDTEVFLFGWSNGGASLLWAIDESNTAIRPIEGRDFRAAFAIYPGCQSVIANSNWLNRMPLDIHIGALDDWTPAKSCQRLLKRTVGGPERQLVIYPDAHHNFDSPNRTLTTLSGLAHTPNKSGQATVGTHPPSRHSLIEAIIKRLRALSPPPSHIDGVD